MLSATSHDARSLYPLQAVLCCSTQNKNDKNGNIGEISNRLSAAITFFKLFWFAPGFVRRKTKSENETKTNFKPRQYNNFILSRTHTYMYIYIYMTPSLLFSCCPIVLIQVRQYVCACTSVNVHTFIHLCFPCCLMACAAAGICVVNDK